MGSLAAIRRGRSWKDRYFQGDVEDAEKLVPEGIEGTRAQGPLAPIGYQLVGGLRQAVAVLQRRDDRGDEAAAFIRMTGAGLRESHPHDVTITRTRELPPGLSSPPRSHPSPSDQGQAESARCSCSRLRRPSTAS